MLEIKSIPSEIKDVDTTSRQVVKYVSAFGNVDSHGDIMQKGAYAKTIRENKARIQMLWNHNAQELPVGKLVDIEEDGFGLKVTSKILNTTKGNDLLTCYQEQAVNEHSVGFFTKQKKSNDQGNRVITEAHLLEYSAVLWGSNANTHVIGMKSDLSQMDQLAELNKRSQTFYKLLIKGNLTDETCERLAVEHVLITKAMDDLIAALQKAEPVAETTQEADEEPQPEEKSIDLLEALRKAYRG